MATGDQSDIATRLQRLLPNGWWTGLVPIRDALLQGMGQTLAFAYSLLAYVRLQTRILTATDGFLDMIAGDFFGPTFARAAGQSDASFRLAIQTAMFRERATRASVVQVLTTLTGRAPVIVEANKPADTGCYGGPLVGYGMAGSYGSMLPLQTFVIAYRPLSGPAVSDAAIYAAVESVRPAAAGIWVAIKN